jgi:hypothetical protein
MNFAARNSQTIRISALGQVRKFLYRYFKPGMVMLHSGRRFGLNRLKIYSLAALIISLVFACDMYDREDKDWKNDVTFVVFDETECPVYVFIDGQEKGYINAGENLTEPDYGQGVHLLQAFPWDDKKNACDLIYTPFLANGTEFQWKILATSPCSVCEPTPTPPPEGTYTPSPTPSPKP